MTETSEGTRDGVAGAGVPLSQTRRESEPVQRAAPADPSEAPALEETEAAPAPQLAARPKGCPAALADDLMVCARCGIDWPAGTQGPLCRPITFEHLRGRALSDVAAAEASLACVRAMTALPTDGGAEARRVLAEREALLRLVEKCIGDPDIKRKLSGGAAP